VVLDEGRLVEAGPPAALIATGGAFAALRQAETREDPAA
jgi:ABC-type multidrug transport system fused ATPase/permease subunit